MKVMKMYQMFIIYFFILFISNCMCRETVIFLHDANCHNPCFRRVFSGKRLIDAYVRRTVECDTVYNCHRMCEYEREFICEGFNYRLTNIGKNICELTSIPSNRVDINRDFIIERQCQYYERDWSQRKCYQAKDKSSRPLSTYSPPLSNNWWAIDPRPINRNSEKNYSPIHDSPVRPVDNYYHTQSTVRPGIDDFYYRNRLSQYEYKRPNHIPPTSANSFDGYSGNGYSYGHPASNGWQNLTPNHSRKYPNKRIGYGSDPETNEIGSLYIPTEHRSPQKFGSDWDNYRHLYADDYHTNYVGGNVKSSPAPVPIAHLPRPPPPPPPPPSSSSLPLPPSSSQSVNERHYYGHTYSYGGGYGYSNQPMVPSKISPSSGFDTCSSVKSTSGFKLTRGIVHKSYLTINRDQCEKLCETQKNFICRTFAYRFSLASTSPFDNCLLSNAAFGNLVFYTDLEPDRDYDIYAMVENSKWCQATTKIPSTRHSRPPDECFWRVRSGFYMPPSVIKKPMHVDSIGECQVQCVSNRDFTCRSFVFRYEISKVSGLPNCFLSDWPAMEIEPKAMQDMDGAELYERGKFGRGCESHRPNILPLSPTEISSLSGIHNKLSPPIPLPPDDASCYADYDRPCKLTPYTIIFAGRVASLDDCRRKCSTMRQKNAAPCMSFNFRIVDDHLSDNCYLSDISMRDLRPGLDYTLDQDYILYVLRESEPKCFVIIDYHDDKSNYHSANKPLDLEHTSIDGKPYAKPENPYYYEITVLEPNKPVSAVPFGVNIHINGNNKYDERLLFSNIPNELSIYRRFTINGEACKKGTKCERNAVMGFWACEPEGGESGAWDYCCEPNHHCGFSQGYSYPWCYVGSTADQWRPCNDKYYPYQLNSQLNKSIKNRTEFSIADSDVNYRSRHWPVIFLHSEAPPNTTDSVALANDIEKEAIANLSITSGLNIDSNVLSKSFLNHTTKRGIDELITVINKKRKNHINIVPLKLNENTRRNRTGQKIQTRINSRFKKPSIRENVTVNSLPRFLHDDNNNSYYITKKLNTKFPTRSIIGNERFKTSIGKIERVTKINNFNDGKIVVLNDYVTAASSTNASSLSPSPSFTTISDFRLRATPVPLTIFNNTTSINISENNWIKTKNTNQSNV